jgi:hypothetical protein
MLKDFWPIEMGYNGFSAVFKLSHGVPCLINSAWFGGGVGWGDRMGQMECLAWVKRLANWRSAGVNQLATSMLAAAAEGPLKPCSHLSPSRHHAQASPPPCRSCQRVFASNPHLQTIARALCWSLMAAAPAGPWRSDISGISSSSVIACVAPLAVNRVFVRRLSDLFSVDWWSFLCRSF